MSWESLHIEIKHPEWLKVSSPQKAIDLFNCGRLPRAIDGWMIVVGLKHPLRAVYGTDVRAAWALLLSAIVGKFSDWWWNIQWRIWPPRDEDDL